MIFKNYKLIILVEEHSEIGGAAATIKNNLDTIKSFSKESLITFSAPDKFLGVIGDQANIRNKINLEKRKIVSKIVKTLK